MKNFTSMLILFCLVTFRVFSNETSDSFCKKNNPVKIYVEIEELVFNAGEIYLIHDGDFEPLKAVYSDAHGLYVEVPNKIAKRREEFIDNRCGNGHPEYHKRIDGGCGGCAQPWCNFRCKCHMPWNP